MKEIIEKLVSENTLNFGKCKTLEDYAELENNFVDKLLEAINYTQCCTELPDANKHQCNCSNEKDRLDCGFECYNK